MEREKHYEIHGENTGLVGFIRCTEEYVKGICEEVNRNPTKEEHVKYNAITEKKYKDIQKDLAKKLLNN